MQPGTGRVLHLKSIGMVCGTVGDSDLPIDSTNLPNLDQYKHSALGAFSLLDVGIHSLTHCVELLAGVV